MTTLPKWISLTEAAEIEGSPSNAAFAIWVRAWNRNPHNTTRILRRFGRVERHSLLAAITEDHDRYEADELRRQAKSAAILKKKGQGHS